MHIFVLLLRRRSHLTENIYLYTQKSDYINFRAPFRILNLLSRTSPIYWASLVAQRVKRLPAMWETQV